MTSKSNSNSVIRYRHVNVRLILTVLAVGLVLSAGVYFLHGYQLHRNSGLLLEQAERARKDGQLEDAMRVYRQYLAMRPGDTDAIATYAELLDATGVTPRERMQAYLRYEDALRRDPDRADVRRKAVDIAVELYRFDDALRDIEVLRKAEPNDVKLTALAARCYVGLSDFGRAAEMYTTALSQSGESVESYVALVDLVMNHTGDVDLKKTDPQHRDSADFRQVADALMVQAVEKGTPRHRALLARAQYYRQRGSLPEASKDVRAALELQADDADVLLEAVDIVLSQATESERVGRAEEAKGLLQEADGFVERGLKITPPDLRFYLGKSRMAIREGNGDAAVATLREGLEVATRLRESDSRSPAKNLQIQEHNLTFTLADVLVTRASDAQQASREADLASAEELLQKLRKVEVLGALSNFLEARILSARGEWYKASVKLEEIRAQFEEQPEIKKRVDLSLSECYHRLGNPDKQLDVWRRAVTEIPAWDEARWNLAAALTLTGRTDEAIEEYRPIMNRPQVAIEVAQLLFLQQMELPSSRRDWATCRQLLEKIQSVTNDWPRVPILLAEIDIQNRQFDKARAILDAALTTFPDEPIIWASLAELAIRRDDGDHNQNARECDRILSEASQKLGDKVELRLARISAANRSDATRAKAILTEVESNLDSLSASDQYRLISRLAQAYQRFGESDQAARLWNELARRFPRDVTAQWFIAELALQNGDKARAAKSLATVRELEGAGGPIGNYLEATALLQAEISPDQRKGAHADARRLLAQVVKERPSWSAGWRAFGLLEESAGNQSEAIEHFRKAMLCGDRSRDVATRVIQALYLQQRYDEADEELRRLSDDDPGMIAGDLARLAWQVAWERQQFDRAIGLAGDVAADSRNHRDLIWLSQLRFARGLRGDDVEKPLREALVLAPDAPESWYALVAYLARVGRVSDAETVINEAAGKIPQDKVLLFEAHCYELLDFPDRAEAKYLAALNGDATNFDSLQAVADFYSRRGDNAKAEKYLDQLLDARTSAPKATLVWARRRKAILVASRGGYQSTHHALTLLDQNSADETSTNSNDLRLKANILASRSTRHDRLAAIEAYKQVASIAGLTPSDQFQLARLYEATGDWPSAQKLMLDILTATPENAECIEFHASALIRQGELEDARLWVGRLERVEPATFRTTRLVAELEGATGNPDAAATKLADYFKASPRRVGLNELEQLLTEDKVAPALDRLTVLVKSQPVFYQDGLIEQVRGLIQSGNEPAAAGRLRRFLEIGKKLDEQLLIAETLNAAQAFERHGRVAEARRYYTEYAQRSPDAMSVMPLCRFLAGSGEIDEALALCEKSRLSAKPEFLAQAGVSILTEANPTSDQIRRVEKWVQSAVQTSQGSRAGLLAQADLLLMQRRLKEAEAIYRLVLTSEEENVVALNNLAWLLAFEKRDSEEALKLINRAMEVAGRRAELVDTRGNVYLSANRTKEAVDDLKDAVADSGAPAMYLHLARAYLEAGNQALATETWSEGERRGLDPLKLHPLDRFVFEQVRPQIAQTSRSEAAGATKRQ